MILGVSGKARSGKGEFANIAVAEFGATQVSFAGPLKQEVALFLTECKVKWEHRHLHGEQRDKEAKLKVDYGNIPQCDLGCYFKKFLMGHGEPTTGPLGSNIWRFTPRSLMQYWGLEIRRINYGDDYWVKQALAQCSDPEKLYVIDDVRFPNEAQGVLDAGGQLIRITRRAGPLPSNPDHPSEVSLDGWPFSIIIQNHYSLRTYHDQIRRTLKGIL